MDTIRNQIIEDQKLLKTTSICVVGVGATGSHLVVELVKLGFEDVTIYDTGEVKAHNCTNQVYSIPMVGEQKQDALEKLVKHRYNAIVNTVISPPVNREYDYVFNCVDDPDSRKYYRENMKCNQLFIETAFDVHSSDLFVMSDKKLLTSIPTGSGNTSEVTSACGSRLSVSASVNSFIGSVTWAFINIINGDFQTTDYNKRITIKHYNPLVISSINKKKTFEWDTFVAVPDSEDTDDKLPF